MEKINIKATDVSPEILLNNTDNVYSISGKSVVSEVDSFYAPVLTWLENFNVETTNKMRFVFDLEYFNIFSSKRILFILYKLSDLREKGVDIDVVWHFSVEDDDMKEVGEDFACMVNLPFEFVTKTLKPQLV
jgi:SiaC family regulatory phosphoprotein